MLFRSRSNQDRPLEVAAPSRFDFILEDDTYQSPTESKQKRSNSRKPNIPPAIIFGARTWSRVASEGTNHQTTDQRPSSPERSQTGSVYTGASNESTLEAYQGQMETLQETVKTVTEANTQLNKENNDLNLRLNSVEQRMKDMNRENKERIKIRFDEEQVKQAAKDQMWEQRFQELTNLLQQQQRTQKREI